MKSFKTVLARVAFLMLLGPISASGPAMGTPDSAPGAIVAVDNAANAREGDCKGTKIEIMTDGSPGETTWELRDHMTGALIAEGDPTFANTLHPRCVEGAGCFDFTIFDSFGDGICCDFGDGFYEIYYFDVLVAEGGSFGSSETVSAIGACDFSDFTVEAPGTWTGNLEKPDSCNGNDCNLRSSEEVMYEVIIPQDGTWTFSLCGSSYDAYLFIGTTCCSEDIASSDDTDLCMPGFDVTEKLPAGTYYVAVEGWSGCGLYELTITGSCICGNGTCEPDCGEHCGTCSADCGPYDCPCDTSTINTYPNCNGFEGGFGDWDQGSCDDIDWTRHSGSTPNGDAGTGPAAAHGGDYYVYTEATGNPEKTAYLEACFDLSSLSNPQLSFWYHMRGVEMGTLRVDVSDDDCGTWTELWSVSDNQWWDWHEALVDLSSYAGSIVTIRFGGTTGNGYRSDMAIDDICVESGPSVCPDATAMVFAENGMTDAGQPHSIGNAATAQGYKVFHATGPEGATDLGCWTLSETDAGNCGNFIAGVAETPPGIYTITLDRPLQSRSVTTIIYDEASGGPSGVFTALPGDANGGGQTNTADIGAVINCLTTATCDLWACDIDRLGGCTGADLERLIDLLNDAGQYTGWEGAIPAGIDCPAT